MSNYIRRFFLILLLPFFLIAFPIGEFLWWVTHGESDPRDIYRIFFRMWKGNS